MTVGELRAIGWVESELKDPAGVPKQGDEGAPSAWLVFAAEVADGLADIKVGDQLLVFTWLDRASRSVLRVHPRDQHDTPLRGVFSTRSASRPNPLGLHPTRVTAINGLRIRVDELEALDRTPIIDIKPVLGPPAASLRYLSIHDQ